MEFVRRVDRYQTKNGRVFKTEDEARKFVEQSLTLSLGHRLEELNKGLPPERRLHLQTKLDIVEDLVGTPERAARFKAFLDRYV